MTSNGSPPPLDYESPAPDGSRPSPMPNPRAAFATLLGLFNLLWTFVALVAMTFSQGSAWLPLPGVIISGALALWLAFGSQRDGVRTAALAINTCCLATAVAASLVALVR